MEPEVTEEPIDGPFEEPTEERETPWALILAGVGTAVAVVALFLALSAKNDTVDEAQVNRIVEAQISQQGSELEKNVTAANDVLKELETSQASAKQTGEELAEANKTNEAGVASNAEAIQGLESQVTKLEDQVSDLTKEASQNTDDIATLTKSVEALEGTTP